MPQCPEELVEIIRKIILHLEYLVADVSDEHSVILVGVSVHLSLKLNHEVVAEPFS